MRDGEGESMRVEGGGKGEVDESEEKVNTGATTESPKPMLSAPHFRSPSSSPFHIRGQQKSSSVITLSQRRVYSGNIRLSFTRDPPRIPVSNVSYGDKALAV
ncbi:hypothetical protein Tco_0218021 [Tanacetum coccineum]